MQDNNKEGKWYPVIYFGKTNLNGRKYEHESLSPGAIKKMREHMDNGRFLGELDHPSDEASFPVVTLNNASHIVESVEVHSDIMFAKIRTLDTPAGKELESLKDYSIAFRPRAMGVINDGVVNIREIISFDAVLTETDSFKDLQDRYTEMIKTDLGRMPELPELPAVNAEFHRKNDENSTEQ